MSQVNAIYNPIAYSKGTTQHTQSAAGGEQFAAGKAASENIDVVSVNEAVKNINSALTTLKRDERQFTVDDELGKIVVKIINSDTKELIRQIPTEEALSLSRKMQEMIGLLFK